MIFIRKLHKWLTLLIGAQLIVWLVTGTIISFIDQVEVSGNETRQSVTDQESTDLAKVLYPSHQLSITPDQIDSIALTKILQRPVYLIGQGSETMLFDAKTGSELRIDKHLAEAIARKSYRGDGEITDSELIALGSDEVRDFAGPIWRINIEDDLATRVYVSPEDGRVLAHRNSRWKVVDFLLMLHFMDYAREDSFNNWQIIIVGFGTLWIAISGVLLVLFSFGRSDFLWLPGFRSGGARVSSKVGSENNEAQSYNLDSALSYYSSLSQHGVRLSSNCDGSGSCGLCKVQYTSDPPPDTAVDREWINTSDLADGFRLGCQHKPCSNDVIVIPDMAFQQSLQSAVVVSSKWLTPLLKEISIRADAPVQFRPGDHLEFQIPAFDIDVDQLAVPSSYVNVWRGLGLSKRLVHAGTNTVARTYSIAVAPNGEASSDLKFTVRFAPPPDGLEVQPGIGSTYMCSLQAGDSVTFRGPGGDFLLHESDREKILIGGGAGMAPLKSMAVHLLSNLQWEGKLRFWYGARNQQEILYRDSFEKFAADHQNFEWQVALSDANDDNSWTGKRGFIHESIFENLLKHHESLGDCEFYICGPPMMLAATREMLSKLGVAESLIRFDDFGN
mgnify:FL=1|tara:strand:+ start:7116 stop:8963 length:1848 start_codon:yes stop_codon:yes gene_type:complete